jgi:hypothetical protein
MGNELTEKGVTHEIKNRLGFIIDNFEFPVFYEFTSCK